MRAVQDEGTVGLKGFKMVSFMYILPWLKNKWGNAKHTHTHSHTCMCAHIPKIPCNSEFTHLERRLIVFLRLYWKHTCLLSYVVYFWFEKHPALPFCCPPSVMQGPGDIQCVSVYSSSKAFLHAKVTLHPTCPRKNVSLGVGSHLNFVFRLV